MPLCESVAFPSEVQHMLHLQAREKELGGGADRMRILCVFGRARHPFAEAHHSQTGSQQRAGHNAARNIHAVRCCRSAGGLTCGCGGLRWCRLPPYAYGTASRCGGPVIRCLWHHMHNSGGAGSWPPCCRLKPRQRAPEQMLCDAAVEHAANRGAMHRQATCLTDVQQNLATPVQH